MNVRNPTRAELAAIQRELLNVELELKPIPDSFGEVPIDCFPSLNLKREYVTPCGHAIAADLDYLVEANAQLARAHAAKAIECSELRKRVESLKAWAIIWFAVALLLLVAFIGLARG